MRKILNPFILVLTSIIGLAYFYMAWRLTDTWLPRLFMSIPFFLIWVVPVFYWNRLRDTHSMRDDLVHALAYVSMGWLNFLLFLTIFRDIIILLLGWDPGSHSVFFASVLALTLGLFFAMNGPKLVKVDIPIEGLDPELEGFRIVQISDLHACFMIRRPYVQRVVDRANSLNPDMVVLTGDIIDGTVERSQKFVAPLAELLPADLRYLVLGNHEYYSNAAAWTQHFRTLGLEVLINEYRMISHQNAPIHIGGVVDPAARSIGAQDGPRPDLALGPVEDTTGRRALRLLLAHNPKLAEVAASLDFDLMLSGHTHAGQFFPWTLVVRMVHKPHVVGLSREKRMGVYVSAGTGSWGPPIRLGTKPEITLIRLVRAP